MYAEDNIQDYAEVTTDAAKDTSLVFAPAPVAEVIIVTSKSNNLDELEPQDMV